MGKLITILSFRNLIRTLVARDLKARYRGSILGFLWSFIDPLTNALVLWFVFTFIFAKGIANLPLFLVIGVIVWNYFASSISQGSGSIIGNGGLFKKIKLSREIFPISAVLSNLINFIFAFTILIIFIIITRPPFDILAWLTLPVVLFLLTVFCTGFTLLISSISVYFRDLPPLTESILRIWYFASPIFYPTSYVPEQYRDLYLLNPAASAITAFRFVIIDGQVPPLNIFINLLITSFITLIIGSVVFSALEKRFADEV